MKNVSLFSALLVLCSAPAFAQAPDNTSRPAQTPDSNSQSDETSRAGNATGSKTTVIGCISERNAKYILMTNTQSATNQSTGQSSERPTTSPSSQSNEPSDTQSRQPQQIELVTTQNLKQHVGHTVRVTGTMTNAAIARDTGNATSNTPEPNAGNNPNTGTSDGKTDRATMEVTDIQMISETCEMKGSATPQPH
jgi:hypothetical protein